MAFTPGNQILPVRKGMTDEEYLNSLKGNLTEQEARLALARYFRSNIGVLFNLITGKNLLPIQEIIIKSLFLRDAGILVAARGFSKSWLLGVCSLLIPILSPGAQICLISANFRGARRILEGADSIVQHPKSQLLKQCFPNPLRRSNDIYKWVISNGSEVFALPLNAEGLRGHRATWLFIDEGLLISKEIQENILRPFLAVKQNPTEEMEIKERENENIRLGIMKEEDRMLFPRNKFFVFSSASFKFQYLYELYDGIVQNIMKPKDVPEESRVSYFAFRFSYKVLEELPNHSFLDMTQVNAAKEMGGENSDYFLREWMAWFPDVSDGYFNIKRLHECTVKFGDEPTVQIQGDKDSKYILSIDPAYSDSKKQDHFAMGVYLLGPEERKNFLVHSYTQTGGELRNHYLYLAYLLIHFNIVFIMIDASGNEFIKGFNESTVAKERNLKLEFIDADLESEQLNEYNEELLKAKNQYNVSAKRIVYCQPFNSTSIRKLNEHLKNQIEGRKVWFASRISVDEHTTKQCQPILDKFGFINKKDAEFSSVDFLEEQNSWIEETKGQTALIQVKATALGTLQFELPQSIKKLDSENKPRRDSYTCLLMGNMGATHYYNIMYAKAANISSTFAPIIIH